MTAWTAQAMPTVQVNQKVQSQAKTRCLTGTDPVSLTGRTPGAKLHLRRHGVVSFVSINEPHWQRGKRNKRKSKENEQLEYT